jgi:hypothetical protein
LVKDEAAGTLVVKTYGLGLNPIKHLAVLPGAS